MQVALGAGLLALLCVGCATSSNKGERNRACLVEVDEAQRYLGTFGRCETDGDCHVYDMQPIPVRLCCVVANGTPETTAAVAEAKSRVLRACWGRGTYTCSSCEVVCRNNRCEAKENVPPA